MHFGGEQLLYVKGFCAEAKEKGDHQANFEIPRSTS